jgi:transposase
MEPLDGNSSDKASFHETIKKVQDFQKQIDLEKKFKWVADSALYTKDRLLKNNDYTWLTRVPETIKEANLLLEQSDQEITWINQEKGYKIAPFISYYGELEQRWLLIFSEQAYKREKHTLEKRLKKKEIALKKALWHLSKELFVHKKDGQAALIKLIKKYPLHTINSKIVAELKHNKRGKPKADQKKAIVGYKINSSFVKNVEAIETLQNKKGRFILATNDLDMVNYPDEYMLIEYKEQQDVEGGFRFIKDPWFMVDSIFLKSPKRIEALMMVMTLCLMVYNVAQFKLRETLKENNSTLPNQLGKPIKNPTLRWIFQIFEGISIVRFYKKTIEGPVREIITNLNILRQKIIIYFGETACKMYGVIQTNCLEGLGM